MQTTVEIPRTEEQLRIVWGMGFKPTKPAEQEADKAESEIRNDRNRTIPIKTV